MWFSMPLGCRAISVERQSFSAEVTDDLGLSYFRAPDHFAARILALQGFALATPPAGAPADLPKADPVRDSAIVELTGEMSALRIEVQNLRTDLGAAQARVAALAGEKANLAQELATARAQIAGLEETLDDAGIVAEVVPIKKAK